MVCNKLCHLLREALLDEQFLEDCFEQVESGGRKVLYEDNQYGFCICGHINYEKKEVPPHNHGSTWAIYGQAAGLTYMTDWEQVTVADGHAQGKVKKIKSYTLAPGDVYYYSSGKIHSPIREPGRLVRIEGQNLDRLEKDFFEPV